MTAVALIRKRLPLHSPTFPKEADLKECQRNTKIWLLDSLYSNLVAEHEAEIMQLIVGMDALFKAADVTWEQGKMRLWEIEMVQMQQADSKGCGVMMLACIVASVKRMQLDFKVDFLSRARERLILDDVLCDMNEVKGDLIARATSLR